MHVCVLACIHTKFPTVLSVSGLALIQRQSVPQAEGEQRELLHYPQSTMIYHNACLSE